MKCKLLLSCEHASNNIPKAYFKIFDNNKAILKTHQGYDIGAFEVFDKMRKKLKCKNFTGKYTRLLIDLNRSVDNPNLFSKFTKNLPETQKKSLKKYYREYRDNTLKYVRSLKSPVLHLSIHSFTPVYKGKTRNTDIGILFDPKRKEELKLAKSLKKFLQENTNYCIHFNRPYRGITDGHCTALRKHFKKNYIGIEIELNQKLLNTKNQARIAGYLVDYLKALIN